jgi:transcriptional regulator with PAS, ATPase and Fis domain
MRLGGSRVIPVNIRVIAATNLDLRNAVQKGEFRADLYYRLNVLKLKLPPLRERDGDVELLTNYFISRYNRKFGKKVMYLPRKIKDWINSYHWPGNVRELENFIERLVILSNGQSIDNELAGKLIENADEGILLSRSGDFVTVRTGTLEEMEREIINKMNKKLGFNRTKLAKRLGISRTTLWKKLNSECVDAKD